MRDFSSCFGENGVQVSDTSYSTVGAIKASQNSVTCVFRCKLLAKSCFISVVWSRNLMGQCVSIEIQDSSSHRCIFRVDVKPSLFSKRKGSKCLVLHSTKVEICWDLSAAKFGSGPEPLEGYYIAVISKQEMVLLVGNLRKEAFKKTGAISLLPNTRFISKKEHISGKKVYCTKAQFCENGELHDLKIECNTTTSQYPSLSIQIDAKTVIRIDHLHWKFRGNCEINIDGLPVEVFWDVHNWLFGSGLGNAVFLFYANLSAHKMWNSEPIGDASCAALPWSWSCFQPIGESKVSGLGFSLILYAWKIG